MRPSARFPLTVGFIPLLDAALLVVAREEGFAEAEGLELRLVREGSWAAIRDRLNAGLLHAAHMLAPAAIASTLGIGHLHVPLAAPVGLNLDGNAITVSSALWREFGPALSGPPAATARALAGAVAERRDRSGEKLCIGVVFGFSCHLYQVRHWLRLGGIDPDADVRFAVIPPPLMVESLSAGLIDIFSAGAPWNRMAEIAGAGTVLHSCAEIMPDTPEKLLVLRARDAAAPWVEPLVAAIRSAAAWCEDEGNLPILARHLARPDYVGAPAPVIETLLRARTAAGPDGQARRWIRLDRDATVVSRERLERVLGLMLDAGQVDDAPDTRERALRLLLP